MSMHELCPVCLIYFKIDFINLSKESTLAFADFWWQHVTCRILVPHQVMEPVFPALGVQTLNQWTTRKVPQCIFKKKHTTVKKLLNSIL